MIFIQVLINNKIHRLPIIDPESGNIMSILNQKPLLKFLYNIPKVRTLNHLKMSIEEAGLGSYENIAVSQPVMDYEHMDELLVNFQVAQKETKVIEALNRFVSERITALPIVDKDRKLLNIYSKFDVFNLESFADLEITLEDATKSRMFFDGVYTCKGKL